MIMLEGGSPSSPIKLLVLHVLRVDRASQRVYPDAVRERQPQVPGVCLSPQHDGRPATDSMGQEGQVCAH